MSVQRLDSISRRTCWVCYAAEEDEPNWQWVHPCHCRGSTKWVHVQCLQTWIDAKQKGNTFQPVRCPQCRVNYVIIYPGYNVAMLLLSKYEAFQIRMSPLICAGAVIGAIYWTLFTYGAVTVMQIYGMQEGLDLVESMDVRVLLFGLPSIPAGVIFLNLIRWEHHVLSFLNRYILPAIPSPSYRASVAPTTAPASRSMGRDTAERDHGRGPTGSNAEVSTDYATNSEKSSDRDQQDASRSSDRLSTVVDQSSIQAFKSGGEKLPDALTKDSQLASQNPLPANSDLITSRGDTESSSGPTPSGGEMIESPLQLDYNSGSETSENDGQNDWVDDNVNDDQVDGDGANEDVNDAGGGLVGNFENVVERGSRSFTRVLAGALSLPSIANMVGRLYFAQIENPLVRTVAGGLVFIGLKGVFTMYYRRQQMVRISMRKIKHFPDEAEVGVQTD